MRLTYLFYITYRNLYSELAQACQDYYPFGMLQPGRVFNTSGYRYGFNGKENDNEVKGEGEQQDYGMRYYYPRLGKFLSVDPITKNYLWYTPYQFAGNTPIMAIDLDGLEEWKVNGGGTVTGPYANQEAAQNAAIKNPSIVKFYKALPEITVTPVSIKTLLKKYPHRLPMALSGAYSTALSMYSGSYSTDASVSSDVMNNLSEEQKQKDFLTNAPKTNGILIWEYLTGTGKYLRQFDERHPVTEEIKYSLSTERAIAAFVRDFQKGIFKDGDTRYYYASSSPDKTDKLGSLKAHARGYMSNVSVFLRGGMEYYQTKHGNNVSVRVVDAYTVASMITRDDSDNIKRRNNKVTPLGTTRTEWSFTLENIDFNYNFKK
ncbi:hypothetical protein FAM09_12905 [Niastella caeni]|uniref:RHS repeat-associated core domain-containing protein n=1 Tax=Niastella caeni TaxID=2569763 RepID=A0A4S8HXA6_9BACT|nr:RHS repeat-associated core domain-containing protein [Niastella caeni]THU39399.1 hypothetical protein FAM09_12905 [Niastella caeni]